MFLSRGLDSSVGIATRYGLDGPGNRIPVGARFFARVETCPGAHPSSYTMGTESFLGVKRPGRGVDHPPLYSSEVKERVVLYLYSSSGLSWPVLGWTLPLPLPKTSLSSSTPFNTVHFSDNRSNRSFLLLSSTKFQSLQGVSDVGLIS